MAVVEARALTKRFDSDVVAVDGVDIATGEGEYLVLLGPSGCGKTTLLRMIAGLEHPTSGQVLIGGADVTALPPRARKIAMVFQSYALYPHKTVFQNIEFPLKAERRAGPGTAPEGRGRRMEKEARREKVQWAARMLGIDHLLDRRPRKLSGGERQRVALARALVREPSVFLLDEPLSNLDAKLRATARDDLRGFQEQIGTTTIYVTHDQVEAMAMGDRIAVMYEGRVRQIGRPMEVYADPADTFVATFLGSPPMNLLERDDCVLGFRPEHLLPRQVAVSGAEELTLAFSVHRVEHLGAERHLIGTVQGLGEARKVIASLPSTLAVDVPAGETHDFIVHAANLRFFQKQTGRRMQPVRL